MDYINNIKVFLDKDEVNEIKDVIVNKKSYDIFINKKVDVYRFSDLNINVALLDGNRLVFAIFSGIDYVKEEEFTGINSMEQIFNIFRLDFEYKGKDISFYLKLEKSYNGSSNEIVKKNIEELDLLRIKATSNDLADLIYYMNFLDLNSHLNVLYGSYLIIAHYFVTKDRPKTYALISVFKKKLQRIGIDVDDIDFQSLDFFIKGSILTVMDSVFALIRLITYSDSVLIEKTMIDIIENETNMYNAVANLIKANAYIHLL